MAARVAQWAFAALYLLVAVLAVWGGIVAVSPPPEAPPQFAVNPAMVTTAVFYFITAAAFVVAAAYAGRSALAKDPQGLHSSLNVAFAAALAVIGLYLTWKGGELVSLGGSVYYPIMGLALIAVAVLLVRRSPYGPMIYAAIVAITVVWSIFESGLDFMALLPRLAAWLVVGLWFLTPWHRAAMGKTPERKVDAGGRWVGFASLAGVLLLALAGLQGYSVVEGTKAAAAPAGPAVTDWRNYGNSPGGTRFAQADQINLENVGDLEEVWRYRTRVPYDFKNTPLQVGELLYICTAGNTVIALDADSGAEVWRADTGTEVPGAREGLENASTFARTCRGLGYHEAPAEYAGMCPKRIITGTTDARLLALDALTGRPCTDFGFDGAINLKSGMGPNNPGEYMFTSAPLIAGDLAVVGGWVQDNQQLGNVSGTLRAYNTLTGDFAWAWDMGNPGYNGLPEEGGQYTRGTPNVWSNTSYDPELNLIFAPTGNASPDYYGPKRRPFDEEFASSVVALDAATGQPRWTYQTVHHDIWDWDVPSQPTLVDITKDGQRIPVVVQPTKRGEVFVLDRRTGEPVWPATTCPDGSSADAAGECPVPQNPVDGEFVTATQPFSGLAHFRPDRWEQDMWGLTPLDQLWCRVEYKKMRYDGHFTPPMRGGGGTGDARSTWGGSFQYPGNAGGFNWPSVSVDADNGLLVAAPMLMGNRIVMIAPGDRPQRGGGGRPPVATEQPQAGRQTPVATRDTGQGEWDPNAPRIGLTSPFMSNWRLPVLGLETSLPCFEPPYGRLAVIDLNTAKLLWSRPIGTMQEVGPFNVGTGLPFHVGTPIYGGTMTTRGGLIFQVGTMDSRIRAIDIRDGDIEWEAKLPGTANGTPITYVSPETGKQYVVISVPNPGFRYPRDGSAQPSDDMGGYVIAYALPDETEQ